MFSPTNWDLLKEIRSSFVGFKAVQNNKLKLREKIRI